MNKVRYIAVRKANAVSALVNFIQAVFKTVIGLVGHSPALFADGLHSFSDLAANFLVWLASKMSHVEPDENHPYGHGRFETIGSFVLGIFLILVATGIAYDSLLNVLHHNLIKPNLLTLFVAAFSIAANESVFHYTLHVANRVGSPLLRANAYHNRADSLTSMIVMVGILGALAGFSSCDAIAAIVVSVFILRIGLKFSWQAVYELTDSSVSHEKTKEFANLILSLSGVRHMHRLRTRKMAERIFLDVHVLIAPYASASEGHYIAETVRVSLMKKYKEIEDITVHIDTEDHPETLPERLPPTRRQIEALLPMKVSSMDLYYFETRIEMRVTLPLSALEEKSALAWQAFFAEAVAILPEIKRVSVCFV